MVPAVGGPAIVMVLAFVVVTLVLAAASVGTARYAALNEAAVPEAAVLESVNVVPCKKKSPPDVADGVPLIAVPPSVVLVPTDSELVRLRLVVALETGVYGANHVKVNDENPA